jgi:hypothetical protein
MNIKQKRNAGQIMGRAAIAQRIQNLANDILNGSYKNAIEKAGSISVLSQALTYDEYWTEKSLNGIINEEFNLQLIIDKKITVKDLLIDKN